MSVDASMTFDREHPAPFPAYRYDLASWSSRAAYVRRQMQVALGLWPMPPRPPVVAEVFGEIACDAYTVSKVLFESLPDHYVSGNLYRPVHAAGPCPAVLNPHGHWKNGRQMWNDAGAASDVATGGERDVHSAISPLQARSSMLAAMGCIVFIYDMVGFGDSQAMQHGVGFDDADAACHLQSFMGLQIWNGLRSLDFLCDLPGVDRSGIGVTGASSGALQSVILAALDDRIHATAAVAMIGLNNQGGCICENAPLLRVGTNNVEFAATIAPRPIGFASANDWTQDFAERGLPQLRHIYGLCGHPDRVEHAHVPFKHNCNVHSREWVYRFFNKHLKLGAAEPIIERPFEPLPPATLLMAAELSAKPPPASAMQLRSYSRDRDSNAVLMVDDEESMRMTLRVLVSHSLRVRDLQSSFRGAKGSAKGVVVCAETLDPADAQLACNQGFAVLLVNLPAAISLPSDQSLAFTLGYNRGILAERTNHLLAAIALAKRHAADVPIHLIAAAPFGPAAMLAAVLSDVDRVAADLAGRDWTDATDPSDDNFLPGSAKYSVLIEGLLKRRAGKTLVARQSRATYLLPATTTIFDPSIMLRWITQPEQKEAI